MASLTVDPRRLERILAADGADAGAGIELAIEGAGDDPGPSDGTAVPVVVDGVTLARVRVTGSGATTPGPTATATLHALAAAIAELELETRDRAAAEAELRARRAEDVAVTLGTDAEALAKGRRQQRSILTLVAPDVPGYDLASHYAAAREIGGDFFELFRLPKRGHPLGIVIADVTGKGLDAALLMAFSRPVMHSALNAARGPADALVRTNRVLVGERRGTLFITALCARLQPGSGHVRVASAGHEPPWHIPADGGPVREVGTSGVLLGAFASIDPPETELTLERGDLLLFYTDGVTDVRGPTGERFGDARLAATVERARHGSAHDLVAEIRDAVAHFQEAVEAADDVTIVAVGRHRGRRRRAG